MDAYKRLAEHLDSLPKGFPPTADGRELLILQKLFTPEEAEIAAQLSTTPETVEEIAARTGLEAAKIRDPLKAMARRGLIEAGVKDKALAFESMPFVVGFYEMQVHRMDAELARLVENYFQGGFGRVLNVKPQFHRVIPAHEAEHESLEVRPFESAAAIVDGMQSWARAGLHLPEAEGPDRAGMQASHRCLPGHASAPGSLRRLSHTPRPEPGRGHGDPAARRRGRAGAHGHQHRGRHVLHLQLLHLLVRHPARHGGAGDRQRGGQLAVRQPGAGRAVQRLRGLHRRLPVQRAVDGWGARPG